VTAALTIAAGRRPMPRLHKLMLLLAFEVLVFGFTQAQLERPRGVSVETTVTPNHMMT
jgi:hypothetical protein